MLHNPSVTQTNMMGCATAGLHKTILPSVFIRAPPPLHQQRAPTPAMWQQPPPPITFTPTMAAMSPMMPTMPYPAINHMGQQFRPPTPAVAPPAPAPTPPAVMMMHFFAPYQQPPPPSETQIQLIVTIRLQPLWSQRPLQPCNQFCKS
jgi:hypothetical protein